MVTFDRPHLLAVTARLSTRAGCRREPRARPAKEDDAAAQPEPRDRLPVSALPIGRATSAAVTSLRKPHNLNGTTTEATVKPAAGPRCSRNLEQALSAGYIAGMPWRLRVAVLQPGRGRGGLHSGPEEEGPP